VLVLSEIAPTLQQRHDLLRKPFRQLDVPVLELVLGPALVAGDQESVAGVLAGLEKGQQALAAGQRILHALRGLDWREHQRARFSPQPNRAQRLLLAGADE